MATHMSNVTFLLDVDNTLLDNDQVIADLSEHLAYDFGDKERDRYWRIFEALRDELGYADYLGALQRYRMSAMSDPRVLNMSSFLVDYPFAKRLYSDALAVVSQGCREGPFDRLGGKREIELELPARGFRGAGERELLALGQALSGAVEECQLLFRERETCEAVVRGVVLCRAGRQLEVWEIEATGSQPIARARLVLRCVGERDRINLDTERAELVLVPLEHPAGGLHGAGIAFPALAASNAVARDRREDLFPRHRVAVMEQEGDQVEPPGGLGGGHGGQGRGGARNGPVTCGGRGKRMAGLWCTRSRVGASELLLLNCAARPR